MYDFDLVESEMLAMPQVDVEVSHHFGPNIYMREGLIPAGTLIIGHSHKTEHMVMVMSGKVAIACGTDVVVFEGPAVFAAPTGRKMILALEETVMMNIHSTSEQDLDAIEEQLVDKSDVWKAHEIAASKELLLSSVEEAA